MTSRHLDRYVELIHVLQGSQKYPREGNFLKEGTSFIL